MPAQSEAVLDGAKCMGRGGQGSDTAATDVSDEVARVDPSLFCSGAGPNRKDRGFALNLAYHQTGIAGACADHDHLGRSVRRASLRFNGLVLGHFARAVRFQMRLSKRAQHFIEHAVEGRLVGGSHGQRLVLRALGFPVLSGQRLVEVLIADSGPGSNCTRPGPMAAGVGTLWPAKGANGGGDVAGSVGRAALGAVAVTWGCGGRAVPAHAENPRKKPSQRLGEVIVVLLYFLPGKLVPDFARQLDIRSERRIRSLALDLFSQERHGGLASQRLVKYGVIEARSGGLFSGGGEVHCPRPRPQNGTQAHGTRLAACVDVAAVEDERTQRGTRGSDRLHFGVCCRIVVGHDRVGRFRDDRSVLDDDRAEGAALSSLRSANRLGDGQAKEVLLVLVRRRAHVRSPKSAVPTRTMVEPSAIATSRS